MVQWVLTQRSRDSGTAELDPSHFTEKILRLDAPRLTVIVCDVWDRHWCAGAEGRVGRLVPKIETVLSTVRNAGGFIIHAPSDTLEFYRDTPARRQALSAPETEPPEPIDHEDPPLPIDDSNGGCDTEENRGQVNQPFWTRQHPGITIDQERDAISDRGSEILSLIRQRGSSHVVILGVHTNMCILNRSFGIKQMVRWGVDIMLCRDLTDAMYDPSCPPHVSHEEGTALVIAHIERHWCPTILSADLLRKTDPKTQ